MFSAGHSATAQALHNIAQGVPLRWSRHNHDQWPPGFRQEAARLVSSLAAAPWFVALPGCARCQVVDRAVQELARSTVWHMADQLPEGDSGALEAPGSWASLLSPELAAAAAAVAAGGPVQGGQQPAALPNYHFQMTGQPIRWRGRRWGGLLRGVSFLLATAASLVMQEADNPLSWAAFMLILGRLLRR